MKILSLCKSISRNTIISTPKYIGIQKESRGNIYEIHKFQWRPEYLDIFSEKFFIPNKESLLCFAGKDAYTIKNKIRYFFLIRMRISQEKTLLKKIKNKFPKIANF
ncbi:MAG TPA: hypothetical protein VMZ91_01750 [Candidatus Paceibacterota bacterium]|nr:hypothetical protein [Candidatus Paceibacterota bacterium]